MPAQSYIETINSSIKILKGVGEKKSCLFNKLGVLTIKDLLYFFPRTYEDRTKFYTISNIPFNEKCCISCYASSTVLEKKIKKNLSLYILRAEDVTGTITIKWFSSPFVRPKIRKGQHLSVFGIISQDENTRTMTMYDMEPHGENRVTGKIIPIYPSTTGLSQKEIRKTINLALELVTEIHETLPNEITTKYNLMPLDICIRSIHNPKPDIEFSKARYRLAFEELLIMSLAMRSIRTVINSETSVRINDVKCISQFAFGFPFELTSGQKNAINDICKDLKKTVSMNRLVQGDVGSGKTAVAACCAYAVVKSGYQVAFMAPTELLANQHYDTFLNFYKDTEIKICLLTSSSKNKSTIKNDIKQGYYDIVIGTHALIQNTVEFKALGLCITDEQHRFGVNQRAALIKGDNKPHILVMSATPIPRTLSLVIYGDLDISVIDTLPSGRKKIDTFCVNETMRQRLNGFIKKEIDGGHQCFVVCPLIEASENIDATSGTEVYERLKRTFPDFNICFLHGKMSAAEKDEIMADFKDKKYDILVSTVVIEVGIDIPNATVMIIENAERFGLSQLHQLRGRVGRGTDKSYCVLVSDTKTDDAKKRMSVMCTTSDGFEIAKQDLMLRGSGEFFGTRQHGLPELRIANLFVDMPIATDAKDACEYILNIDKDLKTPSFLVLKERVEAITNNFDSSGFFS